MSESPVEIEAEDRHPVKHRDSGAVENVSENPTRPARNDEEEFVFGFSVFGIDLEAEVHNQEDVGHEDEGEVDADQSSLGIVEIWKSNWIHS